MVELLTDEAEGLKFKLTESVDVRRDGVIYFTDASYKYSFDVHMLDVLEGRPYGRLISFDRSINKTRVLARHLYFANGVALSPNQDFLIFCETVFIGDTTSTTSISKVEKKKIGQLETKARDVIVNGLGNNVKALIKNCKSPNEIWMKLSSMYEDSDEEESIGKGEQLVTKSDGTESEIEVDFEEDAIKAIESLIEETTELKRQSSELEKSSTPDMEDKNTIALKMQVEESKKNIEDLQGQFAIKTKDYNKLEETNTILRAQVEELDATTNHLKEQLIMKIEDCDKFEYEIGVLRA
ncbi:hypothetical protein NE237_020556 [Protea cynaroides]|uniref:Strictosidine synthase conserved region domain-containing protein n=1 Tax=Protea cynaroides TaxID=273540 RepID=A0A9Q0K2F1_9MAGN|nr:hypothetical protein NE237_020556 [Protea cynaroides]